MNAQEQIDAYISDQTPSKREEMLVLHRLVIGISPGCRLWFLDGRDDDGKIISNPNVGYGLQTQKYAGGGTKTFYQVGMSANTIGISIYIMGISDKRYLTETYGDRIGKVKITGYCIKFRHLRDVNLDTLEEIIANHMA